MVGGQYRDLSGDTSTVVGQCSCGFSCRTGGISTVVGGQYRDLSGDASTVVGQCSGGFSCRTSGVSTVVVGQCRDLSGDASTEVGQCRDFMGLCIMSEREARRAAVSWMRALSGGGMRELELGLGGGGRQLGSGSKLIPGRPE